MGARGFLPRIKICGRHEFLDFFSFPRHSLIKKEKIKVDEERESISLLSFCVLKGGIQ